MFAIAVPSTIVLSTPPDGDGAPETYATLSFTHPTDDVSKCQLTLITADGHMHEAVFNTQGGVVEQRFTSKEELDEANREDEEVIAEREREQEEAAKANEHELKTADDTTAADKAWDADYPFGKQEASVDPVAQGIMQNKPVHEPQHGA